MGTVWLAEDTRLHRRVALKFLQPGIGAGEAAAERLLREARAASALDHPHIATIYEVGDFEGQPFIAMAYYEGETLTDRLGRGPMSIADTVRMVAQVGDALRTISPGRGRSPRGGSTSHGLERSIWLAT